MKNKYRYITCGTCKPTDKLSDFRLIGNTHDICPSDMIRVTIPDSIKLTKYDCDGYSTTESNIQIKDLNPVVIIRYNSRTKINKELTKDWLNGKIEPYDFSDWMREKGYSGYLRFGYITKEQRKWIADLSKHRKIWQFDKIPPVNEPIKLIPAEEYNTRFKECFDIINEAIENDENLKSLIKELDVSDEKLLDIYAMTCFTRVCNTKLQTRGRDSLRYVFADELKEKLEFEKNVRDAFAKCQSEQ